MNYPMPPAPEPLVWMTETNLMLLLIAAALAGAVIGYVVRLLHENSGNRE
jgi:hypothetical protein